MLDIIRVLKSAPKKPKDATLAQLVTPWSADAESEACRDDLHPHPQFARKSFIPLNGWWDYAIVPASEAAERGAAPETGAVPETAAAPQACPAPKTWDGRILVPFSPEAALSGVNRILKPNEHLWYRRSFEVPELRDTAAMNAEGSSRVLLHFEAVDQSCAVWVNGVLQGTHSGGYLPFVFDITESLTAGINELMVSVTDPSEQGIGPRGKQRLAHGGIWYTPQSGIWQSVWLEVVPKTHLSGITMRPLPEESRLELELSVEGPKDTLTCLSAVLAEDGIKAAEAQTTISDPGVYLLELSLDSMHLWSPEDPFLYTLELNCGDDQVSSYCAFRTVEVKAGTQGRPRFYLNGAPLFLRGLLDQGYWSDGLMTQPSDAALVHDIQAARDLGFNLLRKHIKIESDRWYYHCDRLGMLVWQDMVQGGSVPPLWRSNYLPTLWKPSWDSFADDTIAHFAALASENAEYRREWTAQCADTVQYLGNHPSVVTWVLFNEAWGQFEAERVCTMVRALDPSRPIDATSGWYDQGCGDFQSVHNYFRPLKVYPDKKARSLGKAPRAFVISEFGGLSYRAEGHCALESSYGYANSASAQEFARSVRDLLARADALEAQGLAGYVYTQLSDVEEETNGLLSYDRQVNKLE